MKSFDDLRSFLLGIERYYCMSLDSRIDELACLSEFLASFGLQSSNLRAIAS